MFLRKLTVKKNGKKYDYWLLVKTYRDHKTKKVKQKTILHLGRLATKELSLAQSLLAAKKPNTFITTWQDVKLRQSVDFLAVGVLTRIWRYWELDKFFNEQLVKGKESVGIATVAQILAINRAVLPRSDFKVQSWYKKTILPVLLKTKPNAINPTRIYRTSDAVLTVEPALQKYLYEKIKTKGLSEFDLVFYDITSTYFEGIGPTLAVRGHPRGHSNDKRQILLALAITKDGFPFYWRVLKGNVVDVTTVKALVAYLTKTYELKHSALVLDRGMVSEENLKAIEDAKLYFIVTLDRGAIISLSGFPFDYFSSLTEQDLSNGLSYFTRYNDCTYYRELEASKGRRYIICFNPEKFKEERKNREEKLVSIEEHFSEINQGLLKAKNCRDEKKIEHRVYYYLLRRKALKYFKYRLRGVRRVINRRGKEREVLTYQVLLERNWAVIKKESLIDGVYVLSSNLTEPGEEGEYLVSALDLVIGYRGRIKIEQTFHHLKSFIDIRPIYHRLDERVCGHVLICVLGYLLNMTVEYLLKKAGIKDITVEGLYEELAGFDAAELEIKNIGLRGYKITEATSWIRKISRILLSEDLLNTGDLTD